MNKDFDYIYSAETLIKLKIEEIEEDITYCCEQQQLFYRYRQIDRLKSFLNQNSDKTEVIKYLKRIKRYEYKYLFYDKTGTYCLRIQSVYDLFNMKYLNMFFDIETADGIRKNQIQILSNNKVYYLQYDE